MWKKSEEETPRPATGATAQPTSYAAPQPRTAEPRRSTGQAVIGESIRIEGDVRGDEDLLIEGEIEGQISLENHSVTVGKSGRIKADIHGRNISVDGKVQGNLFADEQVIVRESGEVRGNITAPRVSLEDGSKFKGAIDMEPKPPKAGSDRTSDRSSAGASRTAGDGGAAGAAGGKAGTSGAGSSSGADSSSGAGSSGGAGAAKGVPTGGAATPRANVSA